MDHPVRRASLLVTVGLALARCSGPAAPDAGPTDAHALVDVARDQSVVNPPDVATDRDAGPGADASDVVTMGADVVADVPPADPCAGRLLCDDFERYDAGGPPRGPWTTSPRNGSVAVDTTRAFSGTHSVHVHTDAGGSQSALIQHSGAPVFPIAGNVIWGRMMYWADAPANDGVHWTIIHADGPLAAHAGMSATYQYGGQWGGRMMANYYSNVSPTLDCWNHSMTAMPTARWACYEWKFDGPHNEMQLWVDGAEITDLDVMAHGQGCVGMTGTSYVWAAPTFQTMSVGWESYQMDPARDAWVDDVIYDDTRIGCPAAH